MKVTSNYSSKLEEFEEKEDKVSSLLEVECFRYTSDWIDYPIVKIDLDKFVFFEMDFRLDDGIWYIIGHKVDDNNKWSIEELSEHGCYFRNAAKFIYEANKHSERGIMVSRFNSLHYSEKFYRNLKSLLNAVSEIENLKN